MELTKLERDIERLRAFIKGIDVRLELIEARVKVLEKRFEHHIRSLDAHKEPITG